MTYNQFIQAVERKIEEAVKEEAFVSTYSAEKNNGVIRQGITITQKEINISPTIYLEDYYDKFQEGYELDHIVADILRLYKEVRIPKSWDESVISSFEAVEEKIVYRLVNLEANRELLKGVPYVSYLDLAIIFYVMMEFNDYGTACMLIRDEHLEMWNVTGKEVYRKAKDNTWKLLPAEFHTMRAVMEGLGGEKDYKGSDILYVLTNKLRNFGAGVILYEGCLEMIAEYLKDDFYVLPSSVHEVIIVTAAEAPEGSAGLSDMVSEINKTQVDAEEVLSNHVYYYDRDKKKLL